MKNPQFSSRSGFALVEVLVVIAMILTIAVLSVMGFRRIREAGRHGGKAVVVYYDGSTGLISPDDLRLIDTKGGANQPFWKADAK